MNTLARRFKDARQVFIFILAAWFIFNFVQTVSYVLADYSQIPVADYWRIPQYWGDPHAIRWSNFWVQHNEHRIIFPELIDVFDMLLLHGRMYLPIAFSGFCYLGIWCVLVWAAYSHSSMPSPSREIALLLAGIVLFWKGCSTVIATPFQMQFTLLQLAAALAFLFIFQLAKTGRVKYLVAVIGAAVVCTYSSANGMLLWFVLIGAATLLKVRQRQTLVLCVAAVVFIGAFFFQYHFLPSSISTNIKYPLKEIEFLFSYLSMPFGGTGLRTYGFKVGAANLVLAALCARIAWKHGMLRTQLGVVLFGSYVFMLLSAMLTMAGRMDPNDYLFMQAKAWRYVTVPTLTWALLAIALVWTAGVIKPQAGSFIVAIALAVYFAYGFRASAPWVEDTRLDSQNAQITATMLRNGVFDPNQIRTIFPDPEFVRVVGGVMRNNHKSIYAHGDDKWVGGTISSLPVDKTAVAGLVTRVYPVPGGIELFGWADTAALTDDHEILFVNHNRVVGFGRRPSAGLPLTLSAWDTPNPLAFVGYVSRAQPLDGLSVYVRTRHGKSVQPIEQTISIPAFTQLEARSDTAALPGITWMPDPNWTLKGYTADPENGPAPADPIYGSWSGYDEKTGRIRTAPFATPAGNCIVLPELHGRAAYGQSVEVQDADTSQPIAKLQFLDGRTIWERWLIRIPTETHNIVIAADDEGSGPGQWLALATPRQCPPGA